MKDVLPSLEKYASQSCPEETFAEIYHWTFTYLKENEMRKVIDLDVAPPQNFSRLTEDCDYSITSSICKSRKQTY